MYAKQRQHHCIVLHFNQFLRWFREQKQNQQRHFIFSFATEFLKKSFFSFHANQRERTSLKSHSNTHIKVYEATTMTTTLSGLSESDLLMMEEITSWCDTDILKLKMPLSWISASAADRLTRCRRVVSHFIFFFFFFSGVIICFSPCSVCAGGAFDCSSETCDGEWRLRLLRATITRWETSNYV